MNGSLNVKYLLLYLPWVISISLSNPHSAYLVAWIGSFFIFFVSMTGKIKPIPQDLPITQQILRPLFLLQVIFAGYMACTSIFFYLDTLGYTYFTHTGESLSLFKVPVGEIAFCQQQYVLGHAALVTGILAVMKYPVAPKAMPRINDMEEFLLKVALICLPLSFIIRAIPGLNTFSIYAEQLSFVAATLALAISLSTKKGKIILIAAALYSISMLKAIVSGFKEPIIVSFLVLGIFLLPVFGKKILVLFIPVMFLLISILPTYVNAFREAAGYSGTADQAKEQAIEAVKSSDDFAHTNWMFLVNRISEISMFVQFTEAVPSLQQYYGLTLLKQSFLNIIPRIFWPSKPDTEKLIMSRVYKAGVIDPLSDVSAKPATVVDGYLSGGSLGVWASLLIYGLLAQLIALKAEQLFGNFLIGTALVFTGIFQVLWRGNSFEFLISSLFWAYIAMLIFYAVLKRLNLLQPVEQQTS